MPTFQGTTFASFFKRILQFGHNGNTGTPTALTSIEAGDGVATSLSLSDDVLQVQPQNDDTTGTFLVKDKGGSNIFAVDTSGTGTGSTATGRILMGRSQVAANTQYAYFGCASTQQLGPVAGTHYLIPFSVMVFSSTAVAFGTGDDPSTSYDISGNDNGDDVTAALWFLPDNITIDQVYLFAGGNAASGDTVNIHLMSFDIDKGEGAGKGDLSNGLAIVEGANADSLGRENIIYQATAPSSADVDAGKVIVATFESNGTNSDYGINITVKYHIR